MTRRSTFECKMEVLEAIATYPKRNFTDLLCTCNIHPERGKQIMNDLFPKLVYSSTPNMRGRTFRLTPEGIEALKHWHKLKELLQK